MTYPPVHRTHRMEQNEDGHAVIIATCDNGEETWDVSLMIAPTPEQAITDAIILLEQMSRDIPAFDYTNDLDSIRALHIPDDEPWSASPAELAWMDAENAAENARAARMAAYDDWLYAQHDDSEEIEECGQEVYWQELP